MAISLMTTPPSPPLPPPPPLPPSPPSPPPSPPPPSQLTPYPFTHPSTPRVCQFHGQPTPRCPLGTLGMQVLTTIGAAPPELGMHVLTTAPVP